MEGAIHSNLAGKSLSGRNGTFPLRSLDRQVNSYFIIESWEYWIVLEILKLQA